MVDGDRFNGQAMTDNWEDRWIVVYDQTHARNRKNRWSNPVLSLHFPFSRYLDITQFGYIAINYSLDEVS